MHNICSRQTECHLTKSRLIKCQKYKNISLDHFLFKFIKECEKCEIFSISASIFRLLLSLPKLAFTKLYKDMNFKVKTNKEE